METILANHNWGSTLFTLLLMLPKRCRLYSLDFWTETGCLFKAHYRKCRAARPALCRFNTFEILDVTVLRLDLTK